MLVSVLVHKKVSPISESNLPARLVHRAADVWLRVSVESVESSTRVSTSDPLLYIPNHKQLTYRYIFHLSAQAVHAVGTEITVWFV